MIKKIVIGMMFLSLCLCFSAGYAQSPEKKVILLISEQNIEGPQRAWWASEIDLSVVEARVAQKLIGAGYEIIEPGDVSKIIQQDKAFRLVDLKDAVSVSLGERARADYVVAGKAVASAGGHVPQSSLRSCFANISAKLIRVKDSKVLAYLDASGNSVHLDTVTGGKEALSRAGDELGTRVLDALNKDKAVDK